jgi:hypothetical protein
MAESFAKKHAAQILALFETIRAQRRIRGSVPTARWAVHDGFGFPHPYCIKLR